MDWSVHDTSDSDSEHWFDCEGGSIVGERIDTTFEETPLFPDEEGPWADCEVDLQGYLPECSNHSIQPEVWQQSQKRPPAYRNKVKPRPSGHKLNTYGDVLMSGSGGLAVLGNIYHVQRIVRRRACQESSKLVQADKAEILENIARLERIIIEQREPFLHVTLERIKALLTESDNSCIRPQHVRPTTPVLESCDDLIPEEPQTELPGLINLGITDIGPECISPAHPDVSSRSNELPLACEADVATICNAMMEEPPSGEGEPTDLLELACVDSDRVLFDSNNGGTEDQDEDIDFEFLYGPIDDGAFNQFVDTDIAAMVEKARVSSQVMSSQSCNENDMDRFLRWLAYGRPWSDHLSSAKSTDEVTFSTPMTSKSSTLMASCLFDIITQHLTSRQENKVYGTDVRQDGLGFGETRLTKDFLRNPGPKTSALHSDNMVDDSNKGARSKEGFMPQDQISMGAGRHVLCNDHLPPSRLVHINEHVSQSTRILRNLRKISKINQRFVRPRTLVLQY